MTPQKDKKDSVLQREHELLREQIELLRSERDDLRRRLDDETEERQWREWIEKKGPPQKPDATFIAFCRKKATSH